MKTVNLKEDNIIIIVIYTYKTLIIILKYSQNYFN